MWIERRAAHTLIGLVMLTILSVPVAFAAYYMVGLSGPVLENQILASESDTLTPIGDNLTGGRALGLLGGLLPFVLVGLNVKQLMRIFLSQEETLLRQLLDILQGMMQASIVVQFALQGFMVFFVEDRDFVNSAQRLNALVFVWFHLNAGLCYALVGGALLTRRGLRAAHFETFPRSISASLMLGGVGSFVIGLFLFNAASNFFPMGFLFLPYCAGMVILVLYLALLPKVDDQITLA